MDGVLREFDLRGGYRAWGFSRRLHIPGRGGRERRVERRERRRGDGASWARWSRAVQRRPWLTAGVALALLIGLALPALNMHVGSSDASLDPEDSTTRNAYALVAEGFGAGTNGPFLLVAELEDAGASATQEIVAAVSEREDIAFVSPPGVSPDGSLATITAYPRTGPQEEATTDTLEALRDEVLPVAERATGTRVHVGGFTASNKDFSRVVTDKLPFFVVVVVVLSALLLLIVFRSAVIPVKAAIMNLLSIGAALGFVTLIFQEGHGAELLGIGAGPIESFVPVLMFALVFGLSMDYEVFLISRIHEDWVQTGDASGSVARGLQATGRVITAAASIMVLIFASFALGDDRVIKLFGVGLASAVLFDAVIIRCLLVPAVMEILGRRAWWLPRALDRRLPHLATESPARTRVSGTGEAVPDPA